MTVCRGRRHRPVQEFDFLGYSDEGPFAVEVKSVKLNGYTGKAEMYFIEALADFFGRHLDNE